MALLNLLFVYFISFHLLSALSDDSVSNIKVKYNGRNSPRCLTGNGTTACQSLDYVFKNLHNVQAQSVLVSIASPQVVTVKSTVPNNGTTALTLLGVNEDSSSRSDRVSINFNMIQFNFPSISVTFQELEIVDVSSLTFTCNRVNILISDCSLTNIDCITIKPTTTTDQTKLTVSNSLIHDSKFSSNGFVHYIPPGGDLPYYAMYINLYNSNFTKNTGKMLTKATKTEGMGYYGEVRVENCIFSENTDPDFNFPIPMYAASMYGLNFNVINSVFNDNDDFSMIISFTGGGWQVSGVTFKLIGLNVTNNSNMTILTTDSVLNNKVQLSDSFFSNNDGLLLAMNSSVGQYGSSLQVSNVHFQGNKKWSIDVHPQSFVSVANCSFIP